MIVYVLDPQTVFNYEAILLDDAVCNIPKSSCDAYFAAKKPRCRPLYHIGGEAAISAVAADFCRISL